ncbi:MAG: polysaccharide biosynthesis/export family protein [Pseudomonadota bacterium]
MEALTRIKLTMVFTTFFLMIACGIGGEVVKVTTIEKGSYSGLKKEDLAKLDEIKKTRPGEGIDETLKTVIEETKHFSVSEYLLAHPEIRGPEAGDYKVGGYDVLNIIVYEEKDLSREAVRVSADGYISFPLIGRLKVENLNTSEIEKLISLKLAEGQYLLDAHVSVMVTGYNSKKFLVLGAAKKPGSYALQAQERVLDGISKAEGVESEQAGKRGMIVRTENANKPGERKIVINIDLQGLLKGKDQISNLFLEDKDVLFIPTAEHFYIIGEVTKPGSYPLTDKEITLVEAIGLAGGFTKIAARNKTRIIRVVEGVEKIIEVQVDAITRAGKKIEDVIIQPNDVIIVPESFF